MVKVIIKNRVSYNVDDNYALLAEYLEELISVLKNLKRKV